VSWTVGEVARFSGVTVRTLHHYDEIGLLRPSGRSDAGYRLYEHADLERLQRILAYRRLGLSLDKITAILDDPDTDPLEHLRSQHELLLDRRAGLDHMIDALEKTMEARKLGIRLDPEELFEVFGEHDPTQYADEVEERWGDTDAYRESTRRASGYSKADWQRMTAEAEDHGRRLVDVFQAGHAPDSVEAMDLAEEHRQHVDRWFYDCSPATHRALGEMYVTDPRFTATYEGMAEGLAAWVKDAWAANAARQGG
jgi:MerR family transcriptional regulator, thiopeptide resistance regulator